VIVINRRHSLTKTLFVLAILVSSLLLVNHVDISAKQDYTVSMKGHKATYQDIEQLKSLMGVYQDGVNYNVIIDGHGTGLAPPTLEQWDAMVGDMNVIDEISLNVGDPLPSSVDHSSSIYFPPIGNQDGEGSCVAWAVGYYTKTFQEAQEHNWDLSGASWEGGYYGHPTLEYQDKIFSPDFLYHQVNNGRDGGSTYADVMKLITNNGACTWKEMPYDPNDSTSWPSESAWREAPIYRGQSEFNTFYFDSDVEDLKNLLLGGNFGVISINAYLYSELTSNDLWTTDNYNPMGTNHANTIVGFDDNLTYIENGETRKGAFKIANSWGEGFSGDHNSDGFYWISYEAMRTRVGYFMFTEDLEGYNPQTIALFELDHDARSDCEIKVGLGNPGEPLSEKSFSSYYLDGGEHPFPNNKMVLDITELQPDGTDFFIDVFDYAEGYGTSKTGTLTSFTIEEYTIYDKEGNADRIIDASDTPIDTMNDESIYSIIEYIPTLSQPLLSYPLHSNTMGSIAPTFSWEGVDHAVNYNLEISAGMDTDEDGSFLDAEIIFSGNVQAPFFRPVQQLEDGTYYWHVQGVGEFGQIGPWSEIWQIEIVPGMTYLYAPGWNLISFPYLLDPDLDSLLAGMEDKIDFIYRWNAGTGEYEYAQLINGNWKGDFSTLDDINGYWFHLNDVTHCDFYMEDGATAITQLELFADWNLVSWPRKHSSSISDALVGINENIDFIYRWNPFTHEYEYAQYINGQWKGDFKDFEPGYGYWVHSDEDVIWNLPLPQ